MPDLSLNSSAMKCTGVTFLKDRRITSQATPSAGTFTPWTVQVEIFLLLMSYILATILNSEREVSLSLYTDTVFFR